MRARVWLVYLLVAAVYMGLAAYAAWNPAISWASRYASTRGTTLSSWLALGGYLVPAAAFVSVLLGAPAVGLLVTGLGAGVGGVAGADPRLIVLLSLGGSLLYSLASRSRWGGARSGCSGGCAAKTLAAEAAAAAAAGLAGYYVGAALAGLVASASSPPRVVPGLAARAWRALGSTVLGRLLAAGVVLGIVYRGSAALASQLSELVLGGRALVAAAARKAKLAALRLAVGRCEWSGMLTGWLLGAAVLPLAGWTAFTSGYVSYRLLTGLAQGSIYVRAVVAGVSAAVAWITYAAVKQALTFMIRGEGWTRVTLASLLALASLAAAVAITAGPHVLLALASSMATGRGIHVPGMDSRLSRVLAEYGGLLEGLEQRLRLLVALLWG